MIEPGRPADARTSDTQRLATAATARRHPTAAGARATPPKSGRAAPGQWRSRRDRLCGACAARRRRHPPPHRAPPHSLACSLASPSVRARVRACAGAGGGDWLQALLLVAAFPRQQTPTDRWSGREPGAPSTVEPSLVTRPSHQVPTGIIAADVAGLTDHPEPRAPYSRHGRHDRRAQGLRGVPLQPLDQTERDGAPRPATPL